MSDDLAEIPARIASGTTVSYHRSTAQFSPADGWALDLLVAGKSYLAKPFSIAGTLFTITLTAVETAALDVGNYLWEERLSRAGEVRTWDGGTLAVAPNLATATAGTLESRNAKILRALRAAIDIRMNIGGPGIDLVERYTINNRSFDKTPIAEMLDLESRFAMAVAREATPGRWGPQILSRFPSMSTSWGGR